MWKAMLWGFECVLCSRMVGRFGMGIYVLRKGHQASSKPLSPIGIWTCRRKRDGGKLQLKEQHWQEASCSQVGQYLSSLHGFFHQQNDALLVIISCNLIKLSYNTFFWVYLNFNNSYFFLLPLVIISVLDWFHAGPFQHTMAIQLSLSAFVLCACWDLWAEVLDAEQEKGKWS